MILFAFVAFLMLILFVVLYRLAKYVIGNKAIQILLPMILVMSLTIPLGQSISEYYKKNEFQKKLKEAESMIYSDVDGYFKIVNELDKNNELSDVEKYQLKMLHINAYKIYPQNEYSILYGELLYLMENSSLFAPSQGFSDICIEFAIAYMDSNNYKEDIDKFIDTFFMINQSNSSKFTFSDSKVANYKRLIDTYMKKLLFTDLETKNIEKLIEYTKELDLFEYYNIYSDYLVLISDNKIRTQDIKSLIEQIESSITEELDSEIKGEQYLNVGKLYKLLFSNSYGADNYNKSKMYFEFAQKEIKILDTPMLYVNICYNFADLYKSGASRFKKRELYEDAIFNFDNALRLVDEDNNLTLFYKIHLSKAEIYRALYGYDKINSLLDKSDNEYKKAEVVAEKLKDKNYKGDYYKSLAQYNLEMAYVNFVTNIDKLNYLKQSTENIDLAVIYYNKYNSDYNILPCSLLKGEALFRKVYINHLVNSKSGYDDKKESFNIALDLLEECINEYSKSDNQVMLEKSYYQAAKVLSNSWVLDYDNGKRARSVEDELNDLLKGELYYDACINSNNTLENSRIELNAKLELLLHYSNFMYNFDDDTTNLYLNKGKLLIQELDMIFHYEDDVELYFKYYDYVGWWYQKIGMSQNDKTLQKKYLLLSLEYRKDAEEAVDEKISPDNKIRLLKNIVTVLNELYDISGELEYSNLSREYSDKIERIIELYR